MSPGFCINQGFPCGIPPALPQAFPCNIHQTISTTCHAAFSGIAPLFPRDIDPRFSRDIHLERGHALSGHCEAGGRSQWKHFPSICTANMSHRYAWLVGGCADDCHEPDEISVQYFVLVRNLLPNNTIFVTTATIGRLCI